MSAGEGGQEWLHALRNAVNANVASLAVVRRALESGDVPVALTFIAHAEAAGERCRELLTADAAAHQAAAARAAIERGGTGP